MRRTGWTLACSLLLAVTTGSCQRSNPRPASAVSRPDAAPPSVTLRLRQVTATWTAGTLLVECHATLINHTGRSLAVLTNFGSPFDGFTAVVRLWDHGLLARQGYTYHQSPYANDRTLRVSSGETDHTLRFPIRLPNPAQSPLRVQLVGGLRATLHTDIQSNTRTVKVVFK